MCVLISLKNLVWNISVYDKNWGSYYQKLFIGFQVQYPLFFSILKKLTFSRLIFEKWSNIKFHENPSNGSPIVACGLKDGQTDTHDETDNRF